MCSHLQQRRAALAVRVCLQRRRRRRRCCRCGRFARCRVCFRVRLTRRCRRAQARVVGVRAGLRSRRCGRLDLGRLLSGNPSGIFRPGRRPRRGAQLLGGRVRVCGVRVQALRAGLRGSLRSGARCSCCLPCFLLLRMAGAVHQGREEHNLVGGLCSSCRTCFAVKTSPMTLAHVQRASGEACQRNARLPWYALIRVFGGLNPKP